MVSIFCLLIIFKVHTPFVSQNTSRSSEIQEQEDQMKHHQQKRVFSRFWVQQTSFRSPCPKSVYLLRSSSNATSSLKHLIKINLPSCCAYSSLQNCQLKFSLLLVSDSSTRWSAPTEQTPAPGFCLRCLPCSTLHGTWPINFQWMNKDKGKKENILEYVWIFF